MIIDNGGGFSSVILPLLILVIIGIVGTIGWLIWMFMKWRSQKKATTPKPAAPTGDAKAARDAGLLSLRRGPTGAWEVRVNGERYRTLEAVPDDAVRQEVVAGLKALVGFARSYVQQQQQAQAPSKPKAAPQPSEGQPPAPAAPPSRADSSAPRATAPPAPSRRRAGVGLRPSSTPPTLMPAIDLAQEINDIIAELQPRVPDLAGRVIQLQNLPGGGVQFAVDGVVYEDVNDIPDELVRKLIKAATQEWERR
jgi:hypothetical protein